MRDEDEVRDEAKLILGFDAVENGILQGTGQIKTFNQLGFKGVSDKPDGWYLPNDKNAVAIIFEAKSEKENVEDVRWINELKKNLNIAIQKYKKVIGILYNGVETLVLRSSDIRPVPGKKGLFGPVWFETDYLRLSNVAKTLQPKQYYLNLFNLQKIDKQKIYTLTRRINDCLHTDFGIKNLFHRMIFTACTLVAKRYDATLFKGMPFSLMKGSILSTLNKSLEASKRQNLKLDLLEEVYSEIKMNNDSNQEAIDNFIEWVSEISESVSSDNWNGEDVMGIFFNEFNRYRTRYGDKVWS